MLFKYLYVRHLVSEVFKSSHCQQHTTGGFQYHAVFLYGKYQFITFNINGVDDKEKIIVYRPSLRCFLFGSVLRTVYIGFYLMHKVYKKLYCIRAYYIKGYTHGRKTIAIIIFTSFHMNKSTVSFCA